MADKLSDIAPDDVDLRTDVPHPARVYDYMLGGTANFAADRAAAANLERRVPHAATSMRANRKFMLRVVRRLAAEYGIRQFLDIGAGLPTSPNLHEVVQSVAPESRVVYVDNDPLVLLQARTLLSGDSAGRIAFIDADLREPEAILAGPRLRDTLDLDRPVALTLIAVLQFIQDDKQVRDIIGRLLEPLVSGSVLALSAIALDGSAAVVSGAVDSYRSDGMPIKARTSDELARFFDGLDLIDPGVVRVNRWHPDEDAAAVPDDHVYMFGGAAIKP
ncbi:SAM-dependent methyltransferase [Thermopolyspora sp. NPDC052614]|uniref:SAM-dependent methyltransferase n=1 Tax=Thermopolyspora sp. NPDC052614 TaxID=3155682 RepID=UPI003439A571